MADGTFGDMKINGDGTVAGGTYGTISINGNGRILGEITATALRIAGNGSADADVAVDNIVVNGSGRFGGQVRAGELVVRGDAAVVLGLGVGRLEIRGRSSIGGGLNAREVDMKGELQVGGDCQAEKFKSEGAFTIGGLLNAGEIEVRLYGTSRVRELGGEHIRVLVPTGPFANFANMFALLGEKRLTAESIEGDEIELENVTAAVVRGRNVKLGQGADIALVEYSGTLTQAPDARVGEARKTGD